MALKKNIRISELNIRKLLSTNDLKEINEKIFNNFFSIDFSKFNSIHFYLPIEKNKEIDTLNIITHIHNTFPHLKVLTSITDFENLSMQKVQLLEKGFQSNLAIGKWGIPTIHKPLKLFTGKIDIVVLPLLAFDSKGNRVGYGKGFYDRFLNTLNPNPLKIGLCHQSNPIAIDDLNIHDQKIDICVTPNINHYFNDK